jgi:hypothetical protein
MRTYLFLAIGIVVQAQSWKFAVSGDSRNCGDIVMPAIARGVHANGSEFYWHLGDFRAIYTFDEDMATTPPMTIIDYETRAWPDFIAHQIAPLGDLPVYLGIGNHETIPPATREQYLIQFADWLGSPTVRAQRLKDNPQDHRLRTYYHWVVRNVDFINLDNASPEQMDAAQLAWFRALIQRDEASREIRTIVVGMHAALPGSFGYAHSMSDSPQGEKSGRDVYQTLWHAKEAARKNVYLLASHSHFFMEDIYRTDYWKTQVLPGWIVGTAGAVRYRLPVGASPERAKTDIYGFMTGTVAADGQVSFKFTEVGLDELLKVNRDRPEELVRWCVEHNKQ